MAYGLQVLNGLCFGTGMILAAALLGKVLGFHFC